MTRAVYDFVVVGGGSAGAVVAGRLAQATAKVLVLEAGITDRKLAVRIPAAVGKVYRKANWRYVAEPDRSRNGVKEARSAGKVLGGGGSVNSMVYVRGHRADFDGWAKAGAVGWDYDSLLPSFRRLETWERGADEFRGGTGPINVAVQTNRSEANMAWVDAARQAGYFRNPDYNGAFGLEGVGLTQVNQRRGFRSQSSHEYLHRLAPREHLTVRTLCEVHRILIENGRAVGVEYRRNGSTERVYARDEVIVSAGAFGSPRLLMLSGIGPRVELDRVGVDVVAHVPGVGKNLHDHIYVMQPYRSTVPTINKRRPRDFLKGLSDFVLHGKGILTTSVVQAIAMYRTDPALEAPDVQLMFADFAILREVTPEGDVTVGPAKEEGFNAASTFLSTRARGEIVLRSASPADAPAIRHEVLSNPDDMRDVLLGMEEVRRVMEQPAMAEFTSGPFERNGQCRTKADWEAYVRMIANCPSHPVGTCKMGADDMAVVDPELRVNQIAGLRVVDSSIIPTVTRANTNAASMMIGERAMDFVLGPGGTATGAQR